MAPAFSIERADGARLRLRGRVGFANAAAALARSGELLDGAQRAVEVDLSGLQGVDSATLAVLLAWAARAQRQGTTLRLGGAPPDLTALAHLCDAERLLGIA